ncbi:MAG: penicillin-binding protein activator LpoB [Balneolales bacterium]|nr:penicillin-binding protein activator LpoB [Balneolales bacterium]
MINKISLYLPIFIISIFMISACGPSQKVSRISPDQDTDLSGRWNAGDARRVSDEMIADVLNRPWLERFQNENGERPVVIVGRIRNESMEHIDTEVFSKDLERALINDGSVRFVASSSEREALREERQDQQRFATEETQRRLASELGADYMLIGNINSLVDQSVDRRQAAIFYTVNLELVDVETNEKVWIGNKRIQKMIERSRVR